MTEQTILCAPQEERVMVPYGLMQSALKHQRDTFAAIAKHVAETDWPGEDMKFQDGAAYAAHSIYQSILSHTE